MVLEGLIEQTPLTKLVGSHCDDIDRVHQLGKTGLPIKFRENPILNNVCASLHLKFIGKPDLPLYNIWCEIDI